MARKPGKYAAVIGKLPKLPMVEPERRDIVEAVKKTILESSPEDDTFDPDSVQMSLPELLDVMNEHMKDLISLEKHATGGKRYASEFARVYAELRKVADRLESWQSNINLLMDAYLDLMVEQLEVEGISSIRLANGQPVTTYPEPYAQVVDKEEFRLWCIKQGMERDMHLHWGKTNSMTKEMLLAGDPEPPGVTVYAKTRVRLGAGDE